MRAMEVSDCRSLPPLAVCCVQCMPPAAQILARAHIEQCQFSPGSPVAPPAKHASVLARDCA